MESEPTTRSGTEPLQNPTGPADGVTLRAFLVGMICVVALSMLSPVADVLVGSFVAARNQAPMMATLIFFAVVFVNLGIKPFLRTPLRPAEQMVVYCMVLITAGIASTGLMDYLVPHLVGVFYFATPQNDFAGLFFPYIPAWLVPSKDPTDLAVEGFYRGYTAIPWAEWIGPLALWSSFFLAMYVLQFCIANILRKQWVERERLAFPLIQLPLSMVEGSEGGRTQAVVRDPLFWAAAAVVAAFYTYNALAHYFPYVKAIPYIYNLRAYIPEGIQSYTNAMSGYFYPAVIGFFYFATLEVSLSVAFFFLYMRLQQVVGGLLGVDWFVQTRRLGYDFGPASAICQEVGAVVALVLFGLIVMRRHLRDVIANTFRVRKRVDDSREAIPYRWSIVGIAFGLLYLSLFLSAAGMSFVLALALMILLCIWLIVLSRMVAEGGIVWGQIGMEPYKAVTTVVGTQAISAPNWTMIGYCYLFMVDMQAAMLPAAVQTLKVSDEARLDRRKLLLAMAAAIVVCMPLSYFASLKAIYALGAAKTNAWTSWGLVMSPPWPFDEAVRAIENPLGPDWHGVTFMIVGAGTMALLMLLRYAFVWWPIHPIGMTLMGSWAMYKLWFSALLAFALKSLILRYGGLKVYNRLKPMFLGMIFAGFVTPAVLLIVDVLAKGYGYDVPTFP